MDFEGSKGSKGAVPINCLLPHPDAVPARASQADMIPAQAGPLGTSSHARTARVACERGDGDSCISRSSAAPHLPFTSGGQVR